MSSLDNLKKLLVDDLAWAELNRTCKRKAVAARIVSPQPSGFWLTLAREHNGPAKRRTLDGCSGEKGNCGCCHAEPRAILTALTAFGQQRKGIMLCSYSPCTACANTILSVDFIVAVVYDIATEHDLRGIDLLREVIPCYCIRDLTDDIIRNNEAFQARTVA